MSINKIQLQLIYLDSKKLCNELEDVIKKYKLEDLMDDKEFKRINQWKDNLKSSISILPEEFKK
jgi:hypothetical protein